MTTSGSTSSRLKPSTMIGLWFITGVLVLPWTFLMWEVSFSWPRSLWMAIPGVTLIVLALVMEMKRREISGRWSGLSVAAFVFAFLIHLSLGVDRWFFPPLAEQGYCFAKHQEVNYITNEFEFRVTTNNLGLRDEDWDSTQVGNTWLVVGDSYTFGWGVDDSLVWTTLLENHPECQGLEFLNAGKPGTFSQHYADLIEVMVPEIKPKGVLLCPLEINDLYQAMEHVQPSGRVGRLQSHESGLGWVNRLMKKFYPHISDWYRQKLFRADILAQLWPQEAEQLMESFNTEEQGYYDQVSESVKEAFEEGRLNPAIIERAVRKRGMYLECRDRNNPRVQAGIAQIRSDLQRIKKVADGHGIPVIIVPVPHRVQVSEPGNSFEREHLNLETGDWLHQVPKPSVWEILCQELDVQFHSVLVRFLDNENVKEAYFEMDGHFTEHGNRLFAEAIASVWSELENNP